MWFRFSSKGWGMYCRGIEVFLLEPTRRGLQPLYWNEMIMLNTVWCQLTDEGKVVPKRLTFAEYPRWQYIYNFKIYKMLFLEEKWRNPNGDYFLSSMFLHWTPPFHRLLRTITCICNWYSAVMEDASSFFPSFTLKLYHNRLLGISGSRCLAPCRSFLDIHHWLCAVSDLCADQHCCDVKFMEEFALTKNSCSY